MLDFLEVDAFSKNGKTVPAVIATNYIVMFRPGLEDTTKVIIHDSDIEIDMSFEDFSSYLKTGKKPLNKISKSKDPLEYYS